MYEELLNHTEAKIDPRQHGFLRNKSCNTNLLSFTNSVAVSLHDKVGVNVVYFDFAKAFDTVSHDLILLKLKNQYNIDGNLLKFFVNYLQDRKQWVVLDNCSSEFIDVLSGVPQGSILGPLLFVLLINWESHQDEILLKAKRQLGMAKRICFFVKNVSQKRSLYIT